MKFVLVRARNAAQNRAVPGYGQFCPIARASEIFAERWTPLILRELRSEHHHFNEILKGLHRISPSVLGQRLRSLEQVGVIETWPNPTGRGSTYHLTDAGKQLAELVVGLGVWGQQWLDVRPEHCDPDALMWKFFQHLEPSRLPAKRRVVRFEFSAVRRRYWLVLQRDDPDLCYRDPGFGEDLVVRANLEAMVRVYLGQLSVADAIRCGQVQTEGSRELASSIGEWLPCSTFASFAQPVSFDRISEAFVMASAQPELRSFAQAPESKSSK
jgi:DNA-binding HxlR family transcriptional regulator